MDNGWVKSFTADPESHLVTSAVLQAMRLTRAVVPSWSKLHRNLQTHVVSGTNQLIGSRHQQHVLGRGANQLNVQTS